MTREEAVAYFRRHINLYCVTGICREAEEMAIKALSAEPCDDCISRQSVLAYIEFILTHGMGKKKSFEFIKKYVEKQPSVTPKQESCKDCVSREFIEIVVNYPPADLCSFPEYKGKPYFSIKYKENGKEYVGFGTYKIEVLSQYIKEYFVSNIQPKIESEVEE